MNEQTTNPRIIIDASYIREASDGEPFRAICAQGGRIVITDTLIWELATADDSPQLRPSMKKLKASVNAIEIWRHGPVMWREELEKNCPYGDPLSPEVTELWQTYIATENGSMLQDLEAPSEQEKQTREGKSIIGFFQNLACDFSLSGEFRKAIESQPGDKKEVVRHCFDAVNDPDNIRSAIRAIIKEAVEEDLDVLVTPEDVDDTWVIWHFAKSLLVIFCDSLRRGENALKKIPPGLEKRLKNTGQDLNYLTELAFADALASFDKREMSYYRKWMFDDAKPRLRSLERDKIVRFMEELNA